MEGACLMIMIGLLLRWQELIGEEAGVEVLDAVVIRIKVTLALTVDKLDTMRESAKKEMLTRECEILRMASVLSVVSVVIKSLTVRRMEVEEVEEEQDVEADLVQFPTHLGLDLGAHQEGKDDKGLIAGQAQEVIDLDHQGIEEEEEEKIAGNKTIDQGRTQDLVPLQQEKHHTLLIKEKTSNKDNPQDPDRTRRVPIDHTLDPTPHLQLRNLLVVKIVDHDLPQHQIIIDLKRQILDQNLYPRTQMHPIMQTCIPICKTQVYLINRK